MRICREEATFLFSLVYDVCAYVHLCVCVCVVYIGVWVHIFMPVHVELEEDIPPYPLFFPLFLSKQSFTDPETHHFPRVADQQAPRILLALPPKAGNTGRASMPYFLHRCWGFELSLS